jgi:hypothetical protein
MSSVELAEEAYSGGNMSSLLAIILLMEVVADHELST